MKGPPLRPFCRSHPKDTGVAGTAAPFRRSARSQSQARLKRARHRINGFSVNFSPVVRREVLIGYLIARFPLKFSSRFSAVRFSLREFVLSPVTRTS